MRLTINFECNLVINEIGKNYSGSVELWVGEEETILFYILYLNPFRGREAEFAVYFDEERKQAYAEALGTERVAEHPISGLDITTLDFTHEADDGKIGLLWILVSIFSEAIHNSTKKIALDRQHAITPICMRFSHEWSQDFEGEAERYARAFLKSFE